VSCRFVGGRRDDEEVLKNKSFIDRSLYNTVRTDHQHGPNTITPQPSAIASQLHCTSR